MTYREIAADFSAAPRDVPTNPVTNKTPVWFYVCGKDGKIYVSPGHTHTPASSMGRYELQERELEPMLALYERRKRGETVSKEAGETTRAQVYWYGIFAELGL